MKLFLPLLASVALLCACGGVPRTAVLAPTRAAITGAATTTKRAQESVTKAQAHAEQATNKVAELEKLVAQQQDALTLAQGVHTEIDALTLELGNTQAALKDTQDWLTQAATRAKAAEAEVGKMQAYIDKVKITMVKYHRLKWGVILLVTSLVGFLAFKFKALVLPLGMAGIGILIGAPIAVAAALAFIL